MNFLTINNTTSLSSNIHHMITTLMHLMGEVRLRSKSNNLLGRTCTDKNLVEGVLINTLNQVLSITLCNMLLILHHLQLLDYNLRRQNVTTFYQLRCRNIADNITINGNIIHSWFEDSSTMLRSSSEEKAAHTIHRRIIVGRCKEITLNTVMCLVKIDCIYLDTRLYNTV